jgi:hypothetical protein
LSFGTINIKENGRGFTPFAVGEYWSGPDDIAGWLDGVASLTDAQVGAFEFPAPQIEGFVRYPETTIFAT